MVFISDDIEHAPGARLVPRGHGNADGMLAWMPIADAAPVVNEAEAEAQLAALVHRGALHEAEAALAMTLPPPRRASFVAGRVALRAAVHAVAPGLPDVPLLLARPLLRTTRGAPTLPAGVLGSISHKRTHALAIAHVGTEGHIGIDLEERPRASDPPRTSIASRILTVRERELLHAVDATERTHAHRDETLLRFALKEAIYKAIDPIVERYVRFTEVEVDVRADGRADVILLLPELAAGPWRVKAEWYRDDRWIVATAQSYR